MFLSSLSYGQAIPQEDFKELTERIKENMVDAILRLDHAATNDMVNKFVKIYKLYDDAAQVKYAREESGITFLEFSSADFTCSSDEFGSLIVLIKDQQIYSCSIQDRVVIK